MAREHGCFAAFAAHTPFGDGSADDCAKLLEVCKEFLPKPGGLLHVISNLSDTIEIGKERYDIIMPKLAHGFDTSLSRFLGYAFYKSSGDDDNMKITINGKAVSHLKETGKGPFRNSMLKLRKSEPYKARDDDSSDKLPIKASIGFGFTTTEGAGTLASFDERPFGLCISFNGMMVQMFKLLPKQVSGIRSGASAADKVGTY